MKGFYHAKNEVLYVTIPIVIMMLISLFGNIMVLHCKQTCSLLQKVSDHFVLMIAAVDITAAVIVTTMQMTLMTNDSWLSINVKLCCFSFVLLRGLLACSTIFAWITDVLE